MRTATLLLTSALLLAATACGADDGGMDRDAAATPLSQAPSPPTPSASSPGDGADGSSDGSSGGTKAQEQSAIEDVSAYAPAMEQVYFSQGYPADLAGALKTARQLTNLSLSPGNSIAGYVYDDADQEFQLCVENASGAYAVYDTSPMSTIESGRSGGCQ